jgi:hypothetical protein
MSVDFEEISRPTYADLINSLRDKVMEVAADKPLIVFCSKPCELVKQVLRDVAEIIKIDYLELHESDELLFEREMATSVDTGVFLL